MKRQKQYLRDLATQFFAFVGGASNQPRAGVGSAPMVGSLRVDYPVAKRSLQNPSQIPAAGRWSPGEYVALAKLMEDRGARYQVSDPSALNFLGLDEQVPQITYAYNNRISRDEN